MVDILIKLDDDDDKSIEFLKKITKQSYKGKVDFIITQEAVATWTCIKVIVIYF